MIGAVRAKLRQRRLCFIGLIVLLLILAYILYGKLSGEARIVLSLDGTYEQMREKSNVGFSPLVAGELWFGMPSSSAKLMFIDPKYGFVTQAARFFTVSFRDNIIQSIRMSPQLEPLLLDDALSVVLDLQRQWKEGGWTASNPHSDPPFEDTQQWRNKLRDINKGGRTFWQAADKYQVMLLLNRFRDDKRPGEERYLITLALAHPWVPSELEQANIKLKPYLCKKPCTKELMEGF